MSVRLVIGSQIINFPASGADANYALAIVQFAQAVTDQLAAIASQFDVSPRVQILTSDTNTNLDINDAVFPSGSVRAFVLTYAVYRTNGVTSLAEEGVVNGVYDDLNANWTLQHQFEGGRQTDGLPYHTFSMNGDQLQLSTVPMGGSYDSANSRLSYTAKTNLISNSL